MEIQFRKRQVNENQIRFAFFDLAIRARKRILEIRENTQGGPKDSLQKLSYDDLARGGEPTKTKEVSTAVKSASTLTKMLALVAFAGIIGTILVTIGVVVMQRSTISVNNGVIVGNYLPISAPQQSILAEVFVQPGDVVEEGAILARLTNDLVQPDLELIETQLRRAESELAAYRQEAAQVRETIKYASMKIDGDLSVVEAEIAAARTNVVVTETQIKRMQPLLQRANVPLIEYDAAVAALNAAKAEVVRCTAMKESLHVAKKAATNATFVTKSGVSNPLLELETKIAVAEAASRELRESKESLELQAQPIIVRAPSSGTVHAVYRSLGETVKVADHLMALSLGGDSWATGSITNELALQICPGQAVEIDIPSMGMTATGTVAGIGHRAVYGQGGYHTEFRSSPLEVPIRVAMDLDEQTVPSGLRLNMEVRLHDPLETIKDWVRNNVSESIVGPSADQEQIVAKEKLPEAETAERQLAATASFARQRNAIENSSLPSGQPLTLRN